MSIRPISTFILFSFFLPPSLPAQRVISVKAGLINHIEGAVRLDGKPIEIEGDRYSEVAEGMSLQTDSGRAEIELGAGAFLRMDEHTWIRMEDSSLENMIVQCVHGSVLVEIFEKLKHNKIRIRFGEAWITLDRQGLYRIDAASSNLRVYEGKAEIQKAGTKKTAKRGKAANLQILLMSRFDTDLKDAFHMWAARRSFIHYDLYGSASRRWDLWEPLMKGYVKSRSYGVMAYSDKQKALQDADLRRIHERSLNILNDAVSQPVEIKVYR